MSPEHLQKLREMESSTIQILEALKEVQETDAWSSLKELIFDDLVEKLEKELLDEAKSDEPDPNKLSRIAGKLEWAQKYADLGKLEQSYRIELTRIRNQLYGTNES